MSNIFNHTKTYLSVVRCLCAVFVVIALTGCLPRNAFAPPPDNWQMWTRPNTDKQTIWVDLMECGYSHPLTRMPNDNKTLNDLMGSMVCMENLGYSHVQVRSGKSVCNLKAWKRIGEAACLRGEGVPTPDPQRRLNSSYCKKFTKSSICVPEAKIENTGPN